MKTTTKIAITLAVSNSLIVLLFGGAIYYFLNNYSYLDFYKRLETRANIAARYNLEYDVLNAESLKKLRDDHLERLPQEKEYIVPLSEESLKNFSRQMYLPLSFLEEAAEKGKATLNKDGLFYTGVLYRNQKNAFIVIVSAEHYYASHHLAFLRNVILLSVIFILVITFSLALYFSKTVFSPIKKITDNVKRISTDSMHLRLAQTEQNNEIAELTATFNNLLNRLETAFETQKNFVSSASHELGTPLTAIIGEADVTLLHERKVEDYKEAIQKILGQAERLNEITKSLLYLAQTGYRGKKLAFEIVRTDELLWEAKETISRLNPQSNVMIDASLFPEDPVKLKVKGNRPLLLMALANVINNACKYSHNKQVTVSIGASDTEVLIVVRDEGVGIPDEELQFIYDPFFRASNTRYFEGYGIGLPLTRNIVVLHNGHIHVRSRQNQGTTVEIRLPFNN